MEPSIWHWANAQGKPVSGSLSDLRSLLSKGGIPAHAWVWRTGWKHWLPAYRVQELTLALGSKAREPQAPFLDPGQTEPPQVPRRPDPDAEAPRLITPVPPAPRNQPLARRPMAPTVNDELSYPRSTLRPPGAVPPPPRGVPRAMLPEPDEWDSTVSAKPESTSLPVAAAASTSLPVAAAASTSLPVAAAASTPLPVAAAASTSLPVAAVSNPPLREGSQAPTVELPDEEISATSHRAQKDGLTFDPDATPGQGGAPLRTAADAKSAGVATPHRRLATWLALSLGGLCLATGTWLVLRPTSTPKPVENPPVKPPEPPFACGIARTAERVSPRVSMGITPIALDTDHAKKVALGFAESANTAAGISVDPTNLSVQFPYRETQEKRIVSVTPLRLGEKLSFVTVREGIELTQARSVSDSRQFLFGVSAAGLARQPAGQPAALIWPIEVNTSITDPRIVTIPGQGHAVAFRRGGQNGTIQLGYLTADGEGRSAPVDVETKASSLGTPSLGVTVEAPLRLAIAFAGRTSDADPWSLYLSLTRWGKPPAPAFAFPLPKGGPGGDAISPSIASLPGGRWLLQWSEGAAGKRQVRIQLLDTELQPLADTYTVSPVGSNSGQGILWAQGGRAVSFYVVSTGKQAELWATSLVCSK